MQSLNVPPEGLDYWKDEDPEFPFKDWKYAVENGDTRQGYWEWVHDNHRCDLDMEGQPEVSE